MWLLYKILDQVIQEYSNINGQVAFILCIKCVNFVPSLTEKATVFWLMIYDDNPKNDLLSIMMTTIRIRNENMK